MTVKIFLNANDSANFDYSDGRKYEMPNGSLAMNLEGARVRFTNSKDGSRFDDFAVGDIQNSSGAAYGSYAAIESALQGFFSAANDISQVSISGSVDVSGSYVKLASLVDAGNSTTTNLAPNATWTGQWVDTSIYGTAIVGIIVDQNSATDGLVVEYSAGDEVVEQHDRFTILANNGKTFSFGMANKMMRVKYTNGTIATTKLNIQTILKTAYIKPSSHRIADSIVGDDDAELMKAVITGKRDDGTFGNAILDNENRLQVNSQPYGFAIAEGAISGHTSLLKFGTRTAVAANTQSTIWEGTNPLYSYLDAASTLSVVSSSAQDGVAGTGALTITITGLDANFMEQSEIVTMNGVGAVVTTKAFRRAFRAYVSTCGTSRTNVGNINITSSVGSVQMIYIPAGDGQTLMTLWTVPLDKVAYLTQLTASNDSGKGARFALYTRLNDGATLYPWQIKYRGYILGGTYVIPLSIPFKIPAKTDIEIRFLTPSSAGVTSGGATFELWYENA